MKSTTAISKIAALILLTVSLLSFNCGGSNNSNNANNTTKPTVSKSASLVDFFTEKDFDDIFPRHDPFYTYNAFIRAFKQLSDIKIKVVRRATSVYQITRTEKSTGTSTVVRQDEDWNEDWAKKKPDSTYEFDFGNFCNGADSIINKKELAAFFANIAHETRHGENGKYNDGLMLIHESNTTLTYIADNDSYPPSAGKKYYGRGPVQLSYNGNYGYASDCIFGDKKILLDNPEMLETDPVVAFKTAIYFWMTPQTAKPSAHDVMTGKWQPNAADKAKGRTPGFGMTINIINGAVECNKGDGMFSMNDRIGFYQYMLKKLGVTDPNCACSCAKMQAYQ